MLCARRFPFCRSNGIEQRETSGPMQIEVREVHSWVVVQTLDVAPIGSQFQNPDGFRFAALRAKSLGGLG
jgi:hypothetical protein